MTQPQDQPPPLAPHPSAAPAPDETFWTGPWRYPHAAIVVGSLLAIAVAVQAWRPDVEVAMPPAPAGWWWVFVPLGILVLLGRFATRLFLVRGIGSVPVAIVSILAMALVSAPGAIWKQGQEAPGIFHKLGWDHIFSSFPMAAIMALVLANIAIATGKHLWPVKKGWVTFLLTHGGLLVSMGGAAVSSGSLQRTVLQLPEGGEFTSQALTEDERIVSLPFEIRATKFTLENFPPTIQVWRPKGEEWELAHSSDRFLGPQATINVGRYRVEVVEWHEKSLVMGDSAVPVGIMGAGPAVRLRVMDDRGVAVGAGWLHPPFQRAPRTRLELSTGDLMVLRDPQAKKYESIIEVRPVGGDAVSRHEVRVNEPVSVGDWRLYQVSYQLMPWPLTVLDAIRDDSITVVYFGLYMLMAGVCVHLWNAARRVAVQMEAAL